LILIARDILDKLSCEFRIFLSLTTGINCRAMTAREFANVFEITSVFDPRFFMNFFRRCDEIRFSGAEISAEDIFRLLDDMHSFLVTFEKAAPEKEEPQEKKAA